MGKHEEVSGHNESKSTKTSKWKSRASGSPHSSSVQEGWSPSWPYMLRRLRRLTGSPSNHILQIIHRPHPLPDRLQVRPAIPFLHLLRQP